MTREVRIRDLYGLGQKSAESLQRIGIFDRADLERVGPVPAYLQLRMVLQKPPSLNFLYAMVGALRNQHWSTIDAAEKAALQMEVEAYVELENTGFIGKHKN